MQEVNKENSNVTKDVGECSTTRDNPNHYFAGKFHSSYVLCKGTKGDVYAKYVGPRNGYAYRFYSIYVPKVLVTKVKGPIDKWVPKSKN